MSVSSVTEHPDSGKGSDSLDEKRRQRMLIVACNSRNDGATVVLASASVPQRGAIYSFRNEILPQCICRERSVDHLGLTPGGRLFLLTCDYSDKFEEGDQNEEEQNPLAVPPRISGGGVQQFRKVVTKDRNGADVTNSAKEPFLDPPEDDFYHYRLQIVNNEAYVDFDKIKDYEGTVNADAWLGGAAREWLLSDISHGPAVWQAGIRYYEFHYEFIRNYDKWDLVLLDLGKRFLKGGNQLEQCKDANGLPASDPQRLDGAGLQLGATLDNVYKTFRVKREKTFATLGLEGAQ